MTYRLIEKPARISAVDEHDIEICGARQPYGHDVWLIHLTRRVTDHLHNVVAYTRESAKLHVEMIADMYIDLREANKTVGESA